MGSHHHHHHDASTSSEGKLLLAVGLNLLLTVVQVIAGLISGSLALLADALHNFSDCGSLLIALVARRWSQKRADSQRTFGYGRAEVVGAVINLTALIVLAFYLVIEAIGRLFVREAIEPWTIIIVAGVALVIDLGTVALLWTSGKVSLNMRAALLHNLTDALASVGVILVGLAILWWKFYLADVLITLLIAAYVFWHSLAMLRRSIGILMNSAPADFDLDTLVHALRSTEGVCDVHHVHLWQLHEESLSLEAHVVIERADLESLEKIKQSLKQLVRVDFGIDHSTLEFELNGEAACAEPHHTDVIPEH